MAGITLVAVAALVFFRDETPDPIQGNPRIIAIRFEPDPVEVGEEATLIWEVQGAESVAIFPLAENLDPDLGIYTFVATRDVLDNLKFVATNQIGRSELLLVRYEDGPHVPTVTS